MNTLTAALQAVAAFFGWKSKKLDANNTEKMKTAKAAQIEADAVSQTEKSVGERDVKSTRNELAE